MPHMPHFRERCRKLMFNSGLKEFPVIFEMYVATFNFDERIDIDTAMAEVIQIIRTSENAEVAYTMVCHYLDDLEDAS